MPALSPLSPSGLKRAFERAGYELLEEGNHNWVMAKRGHPKDVPFLIPRKGRFVGVELMQCASQHNQDYELLKSILEEIAVETAKDC